ncbi:hypothetical protein [Aquabacterium sp.]|uniref:hypothetical protein n=1 Tax=Aquabacterium sp. TaxID=1872578 RepID=UPI002487C112|nr:hypothetical protein [Aquabacterium sp.]MDI1349198.1 hypothetical protein [Aquabacterium sp.]
MLRYLVRPFAYLGIQHPSGTMRWLNWWLPLFLAVGSVAFMYEFAPSVNLFAADGLMLKLLGFVQSLPGFYVAALAALATFNQPGLDVLMPGKPPVARIIYNGRPVPTKLTRRRFLCLMFSYLTAISFLLTLALVTTTSLAEPLREYLFQLDKSCAVVWIRWVVSLVLFGALFQMLSVTFYGLFYIGERMHTPDT